MIDLTENEQEVLIDILEMTMEDIEDEPFWPDGNWHDDNERYIMQKYEVCEVLVRKIKEGMLPVGHTGLNPVTG
jgi:hypothetical protein